MLQNKVINIFSFEIGCNQVALGLKYININLEPNVDLINLA